MIFYIVYTFFIFSHCQLISKAAFIPHSGTFFSHYFLLIIMKKITYGRDFSDLKGMSIINLRKKFRYVYSSADYSPISKKGLKNRNGDLNEKRISHSYLRKKKI